MNLDSVKKIFGDARYLLALILLVFLVYLVWQFIDSIPNPMFGQITAPKINNLITISPKWQTQNLALPPKNKAPVFKVLKRGFTAKGASAIANHLKVKGQPNLLAGELLKWNSLIEELSLNLKTGDISYKKLDKAAIFVGTQAIDKNFLATKALDFTTQLGINTAILNTRNPVLEYYKVSPQTNHEEPANEGNANLILVKFYRELRGLSLLNPQGEDLISVTLTSKGSVIGFNGTNLEVELSNASYRLKNKTEAQQAIAANKAKVARYLDDNDLRLSQPSKIIVNQGKVSLFDDGEGQFIEPIYIFDSLLFKDFASIKVEVYLPAITSEYLKSN